MKRTIKLFFISSFFIFFYSESFAEGVDWKKLKIITKASTPPCCTILGPNPDPAFVGSVSELESERVDKNEKRDTKMKNSDLEKPKNTSE